MNILYLHEYSLVKYLKMSNISKCDSKTPNNYVYKTAIWSNNAAILIINGMVHAGNGAKPQNLFFLQHRPV